MTDIKVRLRKLRERRGEDCHGNPIKLSEALPPGAPPGAYEHMTGAKWKQTAKDLPLAIFASGIGYGLGRSAAELVGERLARTGERPGWLGAMPTTLAIGSGLATLGNAHLQSVLRNRREAAEAASRASQ